MACSCRVINYQVASVNFMPLYTTGARDRVVDNTLAFERSALDVLYLNGQLYTHSGKHHLPPFVCQAGKRITGKVTVTISRGRVVWEGGKLHVQPGTGRFLRLPTHGSLFQGLEQQDALRMSKEWPYGPTPVQRSEVLRQPGKDEL